MTPYPQRALSVDDQETTAALVEKHKLTFPVGYGADARAVAGLTGAFVNHSRFPAGYEEGHTPGLRLLRVAARVRAEHGRSAVGPFYEAVSSEIFDAPGAAELTPGTRGSRAFVEPLLAAAGLPAALSGALDDPRWDEEIRAEGDEALLLTGRDVGTPIIHFGPPDGAAFFGPVISRLPSPDDAVRLWDHVTALAAFPGFAEFKRSLRERPQLRSFGVDPGTTGAEEDWHAGSRKAAP